MVNDSAVSVEVSPPQLDGGANVTHFHLSFTTPDFREIECDKIPNPVNPNAPDPSLAESYPNCTGLQHLLNGENDEKSTYGEDMRACFSPDAFDAVENTWTSSVGEYVATGSGVPATLSADAAGFYGASASNAQPYVRGSTESKMSFGQIKGTGTFCSMTRYTGTTRRRILNGDGNWLHGHHGGRCRRSELRSLDHAVFKPSEPKHKLGGALHERRGVQWLP